MRRRPPLKTFKDLVAFKELIAPLPVSLGEPIKAEGQVVALVQNVYKETNQGNGSETRHPIPPKG